MNPANENPVLSEEQIFEAAVAIEDDAELRQYLDEVCGDDTGLRQSVERLLECDETLGAFLETPAIGRTSSRFSPQADMVIGRYRLVEPLGEGGFGVVWKAEQIEPVQRFVAIKIIKLGMDTRQIVARFEAERQTLAMMNHANIATVLDAGTTEHGRPYFVMELVAGDAIDAFCDDRQWSLAKRLELFVEICDAVQHAHQKGVVHRDLKPSNILVAEDEGRTRSKIIDFGIAKAMHAESTRTTEEGAIEIDADERTATQHLIGTPDYMSPEQLTLGSDVDTRADVYALGGVLYKLLVGVPPLPPGVLRGQPTTGSAGRRYDLSTLREAICNSNLIAPSQRVTELDQRAAIAEARGTRPAVFAGSLRGDLDAIITKALAKDRADRYESAAEIARDVVRFLNCEPVLASRGGGVYRTIKFVRRNAIWVLASCVACAALVTGGVAGAFGLLRADEEHRRATQQEQRAAFQRQIAAQEREIARQQRLLAEAQTKKAADIADVLEGLVRRANPYAGGQIDEAVRRQLDELADSLDEEIKRHPELEAQLRRSIGWTYCSLGEWEKGVKHLRRALELNLALHPENDPAVARSKVDYGFYLVHRGRIEETKKLVLPAIAILREAKPHARLCAALELMKRIHSYEADYEKAYECAKEGWEVACRLWGPNDESSLMRLSLVGMAVLNLQKLGEAEVLTRNAWTELAKRYPQKRYDLGRVEFHLGRVLVNRRKYEEAKQRFRGSIKNHASQQGEGSLPVIQSEIWLARTLRLERNLEEAEQVARKAMSSADQLSDPNTLVRAQVLEHLAKIIHSKDREEATRLRKEALKIRGVVLGTKPEFAIGFLRQANYLRDTRFWEEAIEAYRSAISMSGSDGLYLNAHLQLTGLLREMNDVAAGREFLRRAVNLEFDKPDTGDQILISAANLDYVELLLELGEKELAQTHSALLAKHAQDYPPISSATAEAAQAQLLIVDSKFDEAIKLLLKGRADIRESGRPGRVLSRINRFLAKSYVPLKKYRSAENALVRADRYTVDRKTRVFTNRRVVRELVLLYQTWGKEEKAELWRAKLK